VETRLIIAFAQRIVDKAYEKVSHCTINGYRSKNYRF